MKRYGIILLVLLVLLCGCQSKGNDMPVTSVTDDADTQMTQFLEAPDAAQTARTLETEAAEGTTDLSESQLAVFQTLFVDPMDWYARALTSRYAQAENVDLEKMFYCGAGDIGVGEPERAYLETQWKSELLELDIVRCDKAAMEDALETVFNRSLDETNGVGLERMTEYNGAYFRSCSDVLVSMVTFEGGDWLNADTVSLYYTSDEPGVGLCCVIMQRCGDRWIIASNETIDP